MKYFSLDLETTGLNPDSCQILEFGAIFEDTDDPKSYEESSKFHAILKNDQIVGQPFALQLNDRLLRIISGVDDMPEGCEMYESCLLYTSPSPRDRQKSRMPSSA